MNSGDPGHGPATGRAEPLTEPLEPRRLLAADSDFVDVIDNPHLPLFAGTTYIYRGIDEQANAILRRLTVADRTVQIMGVSTTVVRDRHYSNGVLVEDSHDYFAQDTEGNVWQFGRTERRLDGGRVISRDGSWVAGLDGATKRMVMPASPNVGLTFQASGVLGGPEEQATVLGLHESAKVPFATFADCLKIEQSSTLDAVASEQAHYAPGMGLVMSQDSSGEILRLAHIRLLPQAFASRVDNTYFPLTPGTTLIYRGVSEGLPVRKRVAVTDFNEPITGVNTTVVRTQEYEDGDLVELTYNWYAQDKAGNVWLFGESSRIIEDGVVVSREGSWQVGTDAAGPSLFMKAYPAIGDVHLQEDVPGLEKDQATVLGLNESLKVPFATFSATLKIEAFSPLDAGEIEHHSYAPGVGLVQEETIEGDDDNIRLAYIVVQE